MFGEPPDVVPDDLSAHEYHVLARWYEISKMKSQARTAYERQLQMEPTGAEADAARSAQKLRLVEAEIPASVDREIAQARFLAAMRPGDARDLAVRTIKDYPTYWAGHRLLAQCYLGESKAEACIESLKKALQYNPTDLQSLIDMARVHGAKFDYAGARRFIDEAVALAPTNEDVRTLRRTIDVLHGMEDETCPISEQVAVLTKRLSKSQETTITHSKAQS